MFNDALNFVGPRFIEHVLHLCDEMTRERERDRETERERDRDRQRERERGREREIKKER